MPEACPFCSLSRKEILIDRPLAVARPDAYPVSKGHTLIIPRRHFASFFDATADERLQMVQLLDETRTLLDFHHRPDGYNIGINDGVPAGQSIPHTHWHLIPRYRGDHPDPRGGVRHVIPTRR